jgi:hypothetical protein
MAQWFHDVLSALNINNKDGAVAAGCLAATAYHGREAKQPIGNGGNSNNKHSARAKTIVAMTMSEITVTGRALICMLIG